MHDWAQWYIILYCKSLFLSLVWLYYMSTHKHNVLFWNHILLNTNCTGMPTINSTYALNCRVHANLVIDKQILIWRTCTFANTYAHAHTIRAREDTWTNPFIYILNCKPFVMRLFVVCCDVWLRLTMCACGDCRVTVLTTGGGSG